MAGAACALRGLQFLNAIVVMRGWPEVEKRFQRLAAVGLLLRPHFDEGDVVSRYRLWPVGSDEGGCIARLWGTMELRWPVTFSITEDL